VSEIFLIGEYLAELQARAWLSHALCVPGQHTAKDEESARDNHVFACNFAKYFSDLKIVLLSDSAINLWLLTTPRHFKYAATRPCNLSLMHLTASLPRNPPVKKM